MPDEPDLRTVFDDPAYQSLRDVVGAATRPLVMFVGAGLSAAIVPTWGSLRDNLIDVARRKAASLAPNDARTTAADIDAAARVSNLWAAFGRLKTILGSASFESEIRKQLEKATSAPIPQLYRQAWELPIQGMVTLNLDSLMVRSFSKIRPGKELKQFTGFDAGRISSVLHGSHSFALSMHGVADDVTSWIFTADDIKTLLKDGSYRFLISRLFADYTILFVGITVDDMAVGGVLDSIAKTDIGTQTHYWLTERQDLNTDQWAESRGIRVIRYPVTRGHEVTLSTIFTSLASYKVPEVEARPVVLDRLTSVPLGTPDEVISLPLESLREALNARAAEILSNRNERQAWTEFESFSARYDEAIHRAWFTTDRPPRNTLFGYVLEEKVAQGAFGRVYRGSDTDGNPVAVKVLLDDIREDMELRKSFRRGIAAMRLLEAGAVEGMVSYQEASEIPAFVSMEWVDGPNLTLARSLGLIADWDSVLSVSRDIASIVRTAHQLPSAVLHRDIRPSNVMLRNGYMGQDDWTVVVLDFDLSTYRGASEKSVIAASSVLGYLAPEQLDDLRTESTRNANVDSFGLGMTMLFLCGGIEPQAFMHLNATYEAFVRDAVRSLGDAEWRSLPERAARLILACTRDAQADRSDLPQIIRELDRLLAAWRDPDSVHFIDMIAEELAARTLPSYRWDEDGEFAASTGAAGVHVSVRGNTGTSQVQVTMTWSSRGDESWSNLAKYLDTRVPHSVSLLKKGGWSANGTKGGPHDFTIDATCPAHIARSGLDKLASSLAAAVQHFNFDNV